MPLRVIAGAKSFRVAVIVCDTVVAVGGGVGGSVWVRICAGRTSMSCAGAPASSAIVSWSIKHGIRAKWHCPR